MNDLDMIGTVIFFNTASVIALCVVQGRMIRRLSELQQACAELIRLERGEMLSPPPTRRA